MDARASPLASEKQFSVRCTNVFTSAKIVPSISILRAIERVSANENEHEVLSSLTPTHLHSQTKGTQTACLFTLKPLLRKLQTMASRLDFAMKNERKMAVETVLCVCSKKKAEHPILYET